MAMRKGTQIVVRIDDELAAQLDEHKRILTQRQPEIPATRSAAARDLMRRALRGDGAQDQVDVVRDPEAA